jgi:hypothetical protein
MESIAPIILAPGSQPLHPLPGFGTLAHSSGVAAVGPIAVDPPEL